MPLALSPLTAPAGMVLGIMISADADGGKPDTAPLIIGGTIALVAAGVVGAVGGVGLALFEQSYSTSNGGFGSIGRSFAVPVYGLVGAALSIASLGSVAAGVTVGLIATDATPPATPAIVTTPSPVG